ncbi:MFS transporter [Cellulomonas denverensis]|uniref:MFS transporter n=1 Tax=Cellulomonas denverensis TaxID=264297 RepID=A0A7X6KUE5_9CELL|nr:MFS transporter [Cellulomonas denverensis]NKY22323.1 MFS transporter [Cellulomonas denverensis]
MPPLQPPRLRRDRFTWTLTGWFIAWGWLLYSFNPAVPLLAEEFGVSRAAAGLHGTAMAAGAVLAAGLTPALVRRIGRRATLVVAGVVLVAGVLLLIAGHGLPMTLSGMAVTATGGNLAISAAQAGLVIHQGPAASAAMSLVNGVGAGIGLIGPLALGGSVALGWGWRPAVAVTAVFAAVTAVLTARLPRTEAFARPAAPGRGADARRAGTGATHDGDAPPPLRPELVRASRWFLVVVLAALATENATTYWATDLVLQRTGAGAGIATATTAGLLAGMTVIRFVVGPLSLRVPPTRLLMVSFGVSVLGWAVLWTATVPWVAVAGLVVTGLGYGALYPLGVALLLAAAQGRTDRAQAQSTLAGGLAIGVAPFLLGFLADRVGPHQAFILVPILAVAGGIAAWRGGLAARAGSSTS